MLILFTLLIINDHYLGRSTTSKFISWLEIPCGFALRWLNLLFTPSFIVLPLSQTVSTVVVIKITAVFGIFKPVYPAYSVFGFLTAMVLTAWCVRGLMILLGMTRKHVLYSQDGNSPNGRKSEKSNELPISRVVSTESLLIVNSNAESVAIPKPIAKVSTSREGVSIQSTSHINSNYCPSKESYVILPTNAENTAAFVTRYIDTLIWGFLLVIGIVIFIGTGYSMPAQLPLNVLTFFLAMKPPPSVRRYIHPIFPCAGLTILGIFALSESRGSTLDDGKRANLR